jgi:ATP-dependent 26S proteasome regulatory subunit
LPKTLAEEIQRELELQILSNRPLNYVVSHEEERVVTAIQSICVSRKSPWVVMGWDVATGLRPLQGNFPMPKTNYKEDATGVLEWFQELAVDEKGPFHILVLKDFHKFYAGSLGKEGQVERVVARRLRNMAQKLPGTRKAVVIVAPMLVLPEELKKLCAVLDWPLPEAVDIEQRLSVLLGAAGDDPRLAKAFKTSYTSEEMREIVSALQGLTDSEIQHILPYMFQASKSLIPSEVASKKRDIIRKTGVLEWIDPTLSLDQIGGFEHLKSWLKSRRRGFTPEATNFGLPLPKGILLLGVPGTGKSALIKAIAKYWGFPLLKLDIGRLYASLLGSTEANLRYALSIAEAASPCILWIDEIEKGIASSDSGASDGGTSSRAKGYLLTWMQENIKPVFIAATSNNVSALPPEILRKGRFDEIFFVDLPGERQREQIFDIHLAKRNRDPKHFDVKRLAKESEHYSGAEIEEAIISAMYAAFDDDRELTTADIMAAISQSYPLATSMSESIEALRSWANGRTRQASADSSTAAIPDLSVKKSTVVESIEDDEEL